MLSPKAVQNLGLVLHELGTNAIKYGALSAPAGRVRVSGDIDREGRLHLRWKEAGGPPIVPPTRTGFGRVVTEQMIAAALQARVAIRYDADGLEWTLELPTGEFTRARTEAGLGATAG